MTQQPGYPNPLVKLSVFSLPLYSSLSSLSRPVIPSSSSDSSAPTLDPRVEASTFSLSFPPSPSFPPNAEVIVQEVAWVSAGELVVRVTDRTGSKERVVLFDLDLDLGGEGGGREVTGKVTRETDWGKKDGGWVEPVCPRSLFSRGRI